MPNRLLISVVDDDEPFRESMIRLLRSLGYTTEVFSSPAQFLNSRSLAQTACLITDIHMPAMTGHELFAHLIKLGHKIPTILVTAYPDEATRSCAMKDGIVCYLIKPFDDNALADCVRKAVEAGRSLGRS
jgi:FixJ family two-component response regulator